MPPAPARDSGSRAELVRTPLLIGAAGAAAAAALYMRDPHVSGSWGLCPFLLLTGEPCPACGGLRAVNLLTNGDLTGALASNAAAVVAVVVMGTAWLVWLVRRWRGRADAVWIRLSTPLALAVGAALAVFGVLRWTPWGQFLGP